MSSANVFEGDLGLSLSKLATNELHSNNDWKKVLRFTMLENIATVIQLQACSSVKCLLKAYNFVDRKK